MFDEAGSRTTAGEDQGVSKAFGGPPDTIGSVRSNSERPHRRSADGSPQFRAPKSDLITGQTKFAPGQIRPGEFRLSNRKMTNGWNDEHVLYVTCDHQECDRQSQYIGVYGLTFPLILPKSLMIARVLRPNSIS